MKILVAGDYIPHNRILEKIRNGDYSYLDSLRSTIERTDYSIVNLETPLTDGGVPKPIEKTGPNILSPEESLAAIKRVGFKCVTLANNHFRDYGQSGIMQTIKICDKWNIDHVGGGGTYKDARPPKIINDSTGCKKIAIFNSCEHEWSIAQTERGGSNPFDLIDLCKDIKEAKQECDYIILITHGGVEWYNLPTPQMQKKYRFLIDQGVDAVINHHQHCFSGYEIYKGKPIVYGLGNFCYDNGMKGRTFWNEGLLAELELGEKIKISLIPIVQCDEDASVAVFPDDEKIMNKVSELSAVISDSVLIEKKFQDYCVDGGKARIAGLQPWHGKLLGGLYSHGWLPNMLSYSWYKNALGLFRCESHRDIMLEYLENKIKTNENSNS